MAERGGSMRWLKYGCLGCAGLLLLALVVAGSLTAYGIYLARSESVSEHTVAPQLPGEPPAQAAPPSSAEPPPPRDAPPGDVVLDLRHGEFELVVTEPGETLRVDASFDERSYVLEESLESDEDHWTYRVGFRRTGSGWGELMKQLFGGSSPHLRVFLPPDVLLRLEVSVSEGAIEGDLGGSWLSELDVELHQGESRLAFSQPLREPLERARFDASLGGLGVSRLGNASPRELAVEVRMGGVEIDLGGDWVADAEIEIHSSMAGGIVRLPHDVRLVGIEDGAVDAPEPREIELPTLHFSVDSEMGEIQFVD